MITSASRRTDIPRFYPQWFFNRVKEKFALVRNPYNPKLVSRVFLDPSAVDCIVFWTKNPAPMLEGLHNLKGYDYYFQFTINGYPKGFEKGLPETVELMETFRRLSGLIGPDRVIWRYSPVLYGGEADFLFHKDNFARIAGGLKGYARRVFISFLDLYKRIAPAVDLMGIRQPGPDDKLKLAALFKETAELNGMDASACGDGLEQLNGLLGISSCVNKEVIEKITGCKTSLKKDKNQRGVCACAESMDIGAYNSCLNGCIYCYANNRENSVKRTALRHNPESPFLIGGPEEGDVIAERPARSCKIPLTIEDYI